MEAEVMTIEKKENRARFENQLIEMQLNELTAYINKDISNHEIEKCTGGRVRTFIDASEMGKELTERFENNNIIIDEYMNYLWRKKYGFDRQQK
jgi:lipopolysaccharide export system protein LptA